MRHEMSKRIVNVGTRLSDPGTRLDLAWEVIAVMFHPHDVQEQRRRQSAGAAELLGERDGKTDDKEVEGRALARWKKMGGFKTNRRAEPYLKQQRTAQRQVPSILMVGDLLSDVWAMALHHETALTGGASISKAIAVLRARGATVSDGTFWAAWRKYSAAAHFCAAFAHRHHYASPLSLDEDMKFAFDEELHVTLAIAASCQHFGTTFKPHGADKPLLDPANIWTLQAIEPLEGFLPPPLPLDLIAAAQRHRARPSVAYPR
jgi:hypothetical protein